jgi:DNA polymerase-3 subunit alpha
VRDRYGTDPAPEVIERLEHELGIICRMGFASYFLIVWDFVRFAREAGIPSSARGSACGALVSYLLKISHVDPLKYDLLFERFLDPDRSEAPDIDIDLCKERRYEVIDYVRRKYGAANVAQIGTFGTMAAKAALKDVGRALNIPLARVDQVTKLVPAKLNITLDEAYKEEPLRRLIEEDPEIKKLFEFAQKLEGTVRNVGTHAAGVVIADRPLSELVPLQRLPNKDKDKEVVSTQWEMGDIERAGLLKMDFLGLRNLTSLAAAVKLVEERTGKPLDLYRLPLDDVATYKLLQRGDAKGVFQLDGAGIRDLLVKMKPDRFADLIALLALYRPGPLLGGMVDEYVDVKHGRKHPIYPHPVMKEVLEETYAVMVYQEQIMRILNRLGGIELSAAYACIKAISKKKSEVIAQWKMQFVAGAGTRGLEKERAEKIFDLIEHFGGYGFNKSHSTAYALLAYHTAYLKANYPTEFMAALLSSEMDGAEREKYFVEHIDDCKRMGIEVLPPDINQGEATFKVAAEGKISFGLGSIKGVGFKAVDAVVAARREGGPFASVLDVFERTPPGVVSQTCVESLIKAGAFDSLGANRNQWLAVLPKSFKDGQNARASRRIGQVDMFGMWVSAEALGNGNGNGTGTGNGEGKGRETPRSSIVLPDAPEMSDFERLTEEKKVLGFYMSSHPLARYAMLLQALATHRVEELPSVPDKAEVILGGMIANVKVRNVQKSRSGLTRMAKLTFEDLTGSVPAMLWPEDFARSEELIKNDLIGFVRGTLDRRRDPAELIVSKIIPRDQGPAELARGVVVTLRKGVTQEDQVESLYRQVRAHPGNLDVYFEILGLSGVRRAIYKAGAPYKIRYDERLVSDLEAAVGAGNVRLLGQRGATARVVPSVPLSRAPITPLDPDLVDPPDEL